MKATKSANWFMRWEKQDGQRVPLEARIHQALAMLVALGFLLFPLPGSASGMMGVAKVAGRAERNGVPLLNGGIVSSGDILSTQAKSTLQLSLTRQQRIWLGPNSSARLTRKAGNLVIALERGTVGFASRGHVEVTIGGHELAVCSRTSSPVRAQLAVQNQQRAQIWLQNGSLELAQAGRSVVLQATRSGLVSSVGNGALLAQPATGIASAQTTANTGTLKGTVVNASLYALPDATVLLVSSTGFTYRTASNATGTFVFKNIPPGTYTLRVTPAGYPSYQEPNLVVKSGQVTSTYVQLKGGKPKTGMKNKGLLIGVIAGAGAALGIGLESGLKGGNKTTTVSPTTVQ